MIKKVHFVNRFKSGVNHIRFRNRILGRSLLWMGLGLSLIILFAWSAIQFPNFATTMIKINNFYWLLFVVNIGLMIALSFAIINPQRHLGSCIALFIGFVLIQAIFTSITVIFSGIDFENFLLTLMIPGLIFLVMGLIAYFDWFDMTRLWPIAAFGSLALLIMSFVFLFVPSQSGQKWWLFLAAIIFIIYIGIDIQMVVNLNHHQWLDQDQNQFNKLALMMGLHLLIDFANLLRIIFTLLITRW